MPDEAKPGLQGFGATSNAVPTPLSRPLFFHDTVLQTPALPSASVSDHVYILMSSAQILTSTENALKMLRQI
jgi:hypothetical protein